MKDDWQEQKTIGVPPPKLYETKGRETGLSEPVNHLSLVSSRPRRGRILRLVPGPCFGVLRHDILSQLSWNCGHTWCVTGRAFIVGFSCSNIDRQGYKSELSERMVPPATVPCKTNDWNGFKGSRLLQNRIVYCWQYAVVQKHNKKTCRTSVRCKVVKQIFFYYEGKIQNVCV